ncbi:MAG: UDP-N-acetylmuramate dehydrogenase [Actinobacteria bacterium]|uniref:UDP-N-acetylmuramate dehydrogenase n=1 Tax=freshwater metagenome TaxID=449393 RepID=A0A6J7J0P2_9ZZZZ|nr:UDP-N-acetylmuramate dehydrogenase [Actinomycetota bacterium]MSW41169.1 UDP-N-acetylmuramate dehydrogenase [Actinomycetota bacterium]
MSVRRDVTLAEHTTLRVGGPVASFIECDTEAELLDAVRGREPVLLVGGGSNLVVSDAPVSIPVVAVRTRGVEVEVNDCAGAWVTVAAGEPWDGFVAVAVAEGWRGVEALSGIPGLVGATPIQNVGAYGQEVGATVARVRAYDRTDGRVVVFAAADCGFGYRSSVFKSEPARYVVLDVTFQLRLGSASEPIAYAELARELDIETGQRAPMAEVRAAVLALRASKGMVLDAADHDTWSVGSFFLNPVLAPGVLAPEGAVTFPAAGGGIKVSAAWLISSAGFERGFALPGSRAAISAKHSLALTNRGGASCDDVLELARAVREGVRARFGITLTPEPLLVGCSL